MLDSATMDLFALLRISRQNKRCRTKAADLRSGISQRIHPCMEPSAVIENHRVRQAKKGDHIATSVTGHAVASAPDRNRQSLIANEPDAPRLRVPSLHGVSNEVPSPQFQRRTNTLLTAMLLVFLGEILRLALVRAEPGILTTFHSPVQDHSYPALALRGITVYPSTLIIVRFQP